MENEKSFELSDVFEDLVDWPGRLAGETPFYRRLFEGIGARSLLDVACGTGQHAALLHSWGLRVEAADVSHRMIERARALFGEPEGLSWRVRGYDEPVGSPAPFDVAICVGNSLALAHDTGVAGRAVASMSAAVREGGAVVLHLLNLWRISEGPCLWQKCRRARRPEGDTLLVKGIHRHGSRAFVELLLVPLERPGERRSTHLSLIGIEAEELGEMLRRGGARTVECFGGYGGEPYERERSVDLVAVARK